MELFQVSHASVVVCPCIDRFLELATAVLELPTNSVDTEGEAEVRQGFNYESGQWTANQETISLRMVQEEG